MITDIPQHDHAPCSACLRTFEALEQAEADSKRWKQATEEFAKRLDGAEAKIAELQADNSTLVDDYNSLNRERLESRGED